MSAQRHQMAVQLLEASDLDFVLSENAAERQGWPTVATVDGIDGRKRIAIHVGLVTSHSRADHEVRFQNPAEESQRLIRESRATFSLLLGFHRNGNQTICVGADASKRSNKTKRFSVLFNSAILESAMISGWSEYLSNEDERIVAFHPSQLPAYLAYRELGFEQPTTAISEALRASGFQPDSIAEYRERGRIATTRVIRDWRFSRDVVQAYQGRCAISGMNWRIVQAAHIYPVSAPGSVDAVPNGLALSPGHHALFDRHKVFINPANFRVSFHPELFEDATESEKQFLDLAQSELRLPSVQSSNPSVEMLEKRYNYFGEAYSWAS